MDSLRLSGCFILFQGSKSPAAAFQDFTEKAPLQNPADTRRRYTQVF